MRRMRETIPSPPPHDCCVVVEAEEVKFLLEGLSFRGPPYGRNYLCYFSSLHALTIEQQQQH
eukprot:scaffold9693_cov94-Skeletonema_dohrnii-CCMP3373.AAC.2